MGAEVLSPSVAPGGRGTLPSAPGVIALQSVAGKPGRGLPGKNVPGDQDSIKSLVIRGTAFRRTSLSHEAQSRLEASSSSGASATTLIWFWRSASACQLAVRRTWRPPPRIVELELARRSRLR